MLPSVPEIDFDDLLHREPASMDLEDVRGCLLDQVVMVTGGAGSIGSELARQVARLGPRRLVIVDRDENSVFYVERELRDIYPNLALEIVLGDVCDGARMAGVYRSERPGLVLHAAAYKHVPLMEAHPDQAVYNNVGGTRTLVDLALRYGVGRFINVSTDKAVNPTSVMGATKGVAEQIVQQASQRAAGDQRFASVRFGNVLGSRGSVVPLFREQIRVGGPVTITHPEMRRYLMTHREAAQLMLQAAAFAKNGAVYVLDMGEPVRIVDLARNLIVLAGLVPHEDIAIEYTGLRPGEKLVEELVAHNEEMSASRHEMIFQAQKRKLPSTSFESNLGELFAAAASRDVRAIRDVLGTIIPSYRWAEAGQAVPTTADRVAAADRRL